MANARSVLVWRCRVCFDRPLPRLVWRRASPLSVHLRRLRQPERFRRVVGECFRRLSLEVDYFVRVGSGRVIAGQHSRVDAARIDIECLAHLEVWTQGASGGHIVREWYSMWQWEFVVWPYGVVRCAMRCGAWCGVVRCGVVWPR